MTVRSMTEARLLEDREQRQQRLNEEKLKKIESDINGIYALNNYWQNSQITIKYYLYYNVYITI